MRRLLIFASIPCIVFAAAFAFATSLNLTSAKVTTSTTTLASPTISTKLSDGTQTPAASISVQAGTQVTDQATLTGATATAGGTVVYTVYSDASCTTVYGSASTKTVTNASVPASDPVTITLADDYYWRAVYSGDGNNQPAETACGDEVLTVTADDATKLEFSQQPSSSTEAGSSFSSQPKVRILDQYDNVVLADNTSAVLLAITPLTGSHGAVLDCLPATNTITVVSGVATFVDCSIAKAGTGYTLTATATPGSLTAATSSAFDITPGPATKLRFGQQPTNVDAGDSIAPPVTVRIEDAFDNLVTSSSAQVSMAIGTNPGSGILSGTTNPNASGGIATFSDLSINKTGDDYTLSATSSGLTGATSDTFDVAPGDAAKLAFTAQPSTSSVAVVVFDDQPIVVVRDTNDNLVTSSGATVHLAITSGTGAGGAALTCTPPTNDQTASGGIATFAGCSIDLAGDDYTLTATSVGLTLATSITFDITAPVSAASDCFRSLASGNWASTSTWQSADAPGCTNWHAATLAPDFNASTITVRASHSVAVAAAVTADEVTVVSGGTLTVNSGVTFMLASGVGDDLTVDGTGAAGNALRVLGSISMNGAASISIDGSAVVEDTAGGGPGAIFSNAENNDITVGEDGVLTVKSTGNGSSAQGIRLLDDDEGGQLRVDGTLTVDGGTILTQQANSFIVNGDATLSNGANVTNSIDEADTVARINSSGTLSLLGTSTWTLTGHADAVGAVGSGGTLEAGASAYVNGGGSLEVAAGGTIKVRSADGLGNAGNTDGNVRTTGSADSYDSTIVFDGAVAQITGIGFTTNNLTIDNEDGVTLSDDVTVTGGLALTNGDITTTSSFALTQPVSAPASTGTGDVVGTVIRSGSLATATAYTFGNPNVQFARSGGTGTWTSVSIELEKAAPYTGAVERTYTVEVNGTSLAGYTATLRLHYLDDELDGNVEGTLVLWHLDGVWDEMGFTTRNTSANWVELTGIAPADIEGEWTLDDPTPP